jgi:hypothetical protein
MFLGRARQQSRMARRSQGREKGAVPSERGKPTSRRGIMSVAVHIGDWNRRPGREWLLIEDDDGRHWSYRQGRPVPPDGLTPVVVFHPDMPPELAASGGQVLLRQEEPGLPELIHVRVVEAPGPSAPWEAVHQYQREPDPVG